MGKFKNLKRRGWIKHRVKLPESDADHSFSVALLVLLLAPKSLDKLKCLELALIHDLAEVYAGDVTPEDNVTEADKYAAEKAGILRLAGELEFAELVELFDEYEAKKTEEAVFVNALDKLDTVVTAAFYDRENRAEQKLLPEFSAYAQKRVQELSQIGLDEVKRFLDYLQEEGKINE